MTARSIYNLYQLAARPTFRYVLQTARSSELNIVRHFQKTGIRAGVTAAFVPNDHTTITRTFPTSHHSLKIGFQDNLASNFYYIWLRDNCQCTSCIHSESRQKMVDTVSLDLNIKPRCYHVTDNGKLKIVWPDGHISLYDSDWLHKHGTDFELDSYDNIHDNMPPFTTWDGEMIRNIKPEISYEELMKTEEGLKKWLTMMYKYGIVILKGTPCVKNEVLKVMERIAYVKKTKWGASFDVICKPVQTDPKHLAYTGMYLELHTDMNYLEKSPVFPRKSCNDQSRASNDFLCAIVHSSQTISLHFCNTFPMSDDLEIYCIWKFQLFECLMAVSNHQAVLPPGNNVAAIPDDARTQAMSFWDRTAARINFIRNVLPVPPGTSKKKIFPFHQFEFK
ncbi:trimethyllysine dioxygenase, mitochondrial [Trichonephila clavipes]|nr:trimethyllysine dioxygenase, mitochondrial [Trichonephila clavipes]